MLAETVAERYAAALFALAKEQSRVLEMHAELERILLILQEQPTLARALKKPDHPDAVKRNIIRDIFGKLLSPLMLNFLYVLIDKHRVDALEAIVERFRILVCESEGKVNVRVEVASALPESLRRAVEAWISAHTGRQALVEWCTNADILGGVVVRIRDKLIDYSLRTQLQEMKERLMRARLGSI